MAGQQFVEQFRQLRLRETAVGMAGKILITTAFPLSDARYCATSCIIGPHRQVVSVQPAGVQLEIIGDQLERFRHVPALAVKIKRVGVVLNRWPFIKPEH